MLRSARELANYLSAQLEGDPETHVSGLASPEAAGAEDLIYIDSPRQLAHARESAARCVLLSRDLPLAGKTLLRTANPKLAFAKAATLLISPERPAASIHPTAIVAPTARLAADITIGPYAVIEAGASIGARTQIGAFGFVGSHASIGEDCCLYPRVTLYPGARLGRRVVVHSGAVIGGDGFGYVFSEGRYWKFPQLGSVEIGDDVEIGSNATVARGSLGVTKIGQGVKIDNLVQVAHNVTIGEHSVVAAQTGISGSSTLGSHVVVGGQVGIAEHCVVKDGATLGAQAGIPTGKIIPAGETVWGTPARPLERFKKQYAWFARLPELAKRVQKLEAEAS